MTLDHFAIVFLERGTTLYNLLRVLGRPAMPIACFLLAEGFMKTSSRKKYILRMFITAIIAELFWFYLWSQQYAVAMDGLREAYAKAGGTPVYGEDGLNTWFKTLSQAEQASYTGWMIPMLNILFTFTICLFMLLAVKAIQDRFGEMLPKQFMHNLANVGLLGGVIMVTLLVCMLFPLELDYAIEAPMFVLLCYLFRNEKKTKGIMLVVLSLFMVTQSIPYAFATLMGVLCILTYNGELGYDKARNPIVRTLFYAYYPVHLGILVESRYFQDIYSNFFGK